MPHEPTCGGHTAHPVTHTYRQQGIHAAPLPCFHCPARLKQDTRHTPTHTPSPGPPSPPPPHLQQCLPMCTCCPLSSCCRHPKSSALQVVHQQPPPPRPSPPPPHLQQCLPALPKSRCLDGHHVQDATQLVHHKGGQRLTCDMGGGGSVGQGAMPAG
jgi:hypothetical protein